MAKKLVKTDKNGTKYFEEVVKCWKCNGSGIYSWGMNGSYSGECFQCDGRGEYVVKTKEYTPEHEAKLEKAREKRRLERVAKWEKIEAERQKRIDARNAAQAAREAEWERQKAASNYVGEVGDKLDAVFTIAYEAEYEVPSFTGYGTSTRRVYGMRDADGNMLVWKTGAYMDIEVVNKFGHVRSIFAHKGDRVHVKATIKAHEEYKGEKQTQLTRCKLLEIVERTDVAAYGSLEEV